jgi:hypothetical protein
MKANPDRRNFIKLAIAGTLGSKFLFSGLKYSEPTLRKLFTHSRPALKAAK